MKTLSLAALILISIFYSGCKGGGGDPEPSKQDEVRTMLSSGTWKISGVQVDAVAKSNYLTGLTLTFSSSTFSATNGKPIFPAQGNWSFSNEEATGFETGDGLDVAITNISNQALSLSFTYTQTTFGPGRSASVNGSHVLMFTK